MAEQTVGQKEDKKAFLEMVECWNDQRLTRAGDTVGDLALELARFAWDAGVRRGLSLRGCCSDREPDSE